MKFACCQIFIILFAVCVAQQVFAQGAWTQKADFSGVGRIKSVGFSIGNKGYIGTGQTAGPYLKDFWEYDPCDAWIRRADFPGTARTGAVGFSIGNKGYIGTGDDGSGSYEKDFWEYDSATNVWTRKADFAGIGRRFAFGFSIGNKGYIGTGETTSGLRNDFWEYDPSLDTWTQVNSLPAAGRKYAGGFVVNGNAYVGCGTPGPLRDFWEFNPVANSWTQKTNYPGHGPEATTSFTLGNYGYMGLGDNYVTFGTDLWQYNPINDSWTQMATFTGTARETAVGFSICGKGYVGTGGQGTSIFVNEFWEYAPPGFVANNCFTPPIADFNSNVTNVCGYSCANFSDANLFDPLSWQWTFSGSLSPFSTIQNPSSICYNTSGNYDVTLIVAKGSCADTVTKNLLISIDIPPAATASPDTAICNQQNVTLSATGGGSYSWSPASFLSCTSCQNPVANPDQTTTYAVTVTDSNGCSASDSVTISVLSPIANFSEPPTICVGECVDFTDQSQNNPTFWQWTFTGANTPVSNIQNPDSICYSSVGNHSITLVSYNGSCSDTVVKSIHVSPLPTASTSPDSTICSQDSIMLSATGGVSYTWLPSTSLSCTTCQDPLASPTQTTTYSVIVTDSNGCASSDSVVISVRSSTPINASPDTSICELQNVILNVTDGVNYLWSPSTFLSCTSCQNPTTAPNQTTIYTVTVTDSNGCRASDSVTITVLSPIANFSEPPALCIGECVDFIDQSQNNPTSWQWTFTGANTSVSNIQSPNGICYLSEGSFDVTLITANQNCMDTIAKFITVVDSCSFITVSDSNLCPGDCIDFFAEVLPTASDFLWLFSGASPASSTSRNPTGICYPSNGVYSVSVTFFVNGVSDTIIKDDFIMVTDSACPILLDTITVYANGDANGGLICADECLNFTAQSTTPADSYLWEFPGGQPNTSNAQNPVGICYPDEGVFDIVLIHSKNGISDTILKSGFVTVVRADILVSLSDSIVESGSQVQLNVQGGATYIWTSDALLDCYDCPNPVSVITSTSNFLVEVTDSNGCVFRDTILVRVENSCGDAIMIASAFSPNGDTKNDFIQPFINADISFFSFKIFNRWGEEVFTSNDTRLLWDGTYKGAQQDVQVFTYVVQFSCLGKEYLKSGNITLVR